MSDLRIPFRSNVEGTMVQPEVTFAFDGSELMGFEGEPIVAALFASGVRIFRTMPKTGAPRGGFCFSGRCSDCQMIVNGVPNVMACITPLAAGMHVETQHGVGHWPEVERAE